MNTPQFQTQLFINNEFVDALDGGTFDVFNPFDNSLLAKVAEAKPADIDRAVAAARKAFPAWDLQVFGTSTVSGASAEISLTDEMGTPADTTDDAGHLIAVYGNFATASGGKLRMKRVGHAGTLVDPPLADMVMTGGTRREHFHHQIRGSAHAAPIQFGGIADHQHIRLQHRIHLLIRFPCLRKSHIDRRD